MYTWKRMKVQCGNKTMHLINLHCTCTPLQNAHNTNKATTIQRKLLKFWREKDNIILKFVLSSYHLNGDECGEAE